MTGAKQYGTAWVYPPLPCATGHAQPFTEQVRIEACLDLTADCKVLFDARGALDAPDRIPAGGVRAQEFEPASEGRLLIGHVYRDGWYR